MGERKLGGRTASQIVPENIRMLFWQKNSHSHCDESSWPPALLEGDLSHTAQKPQEQWMTSADPTHAVVLAEPLPSTRGTSSFMDHAPVLASTSKCLRTRTQVKPYSPTGNPGRKAIRREGRRTVPSAFPMLPSQTFMEMALELVSPPAPQTLFHFKHIHFADFSWAVNPVRVQHLG